MSVLFFASALVLACAPAEILSGDRLLCEGRTVQLADIRARGADAEGMLRKLAGTETTICRSHGPQQGDIILARCWTNGGDLGCAMLRVDRAVLLDPRRPSRC
jgi:endonuclease YncB( thermonuclease family)